MDLKKLSLLIIFLYALSFTSAFTANKTERSMIPQLNVRPKATLKVLMKDARIEGIDDSSKTLEEKKSLECENVTTLESPLRETRFRDLNNDSTNTAGFVRIINGIKSNANNQEEMKFLPTIDIIESDPLNVVLLLINDFNQYKESLRRNIHESILFSLSDQLQCCHAKQEYYDFIEKYDIECECEDSFRSSVLSLLAWAQHVKEMSISTLYEMPTINRQRLEIYNDGFRRINPLYFQFPDNLRLRDAKESVLIELPATKRDLEEKEGNEERMKKGWRVMDALRMLRQSVMNIFARDNSAVSQYHQLRRALIPRFSSFHEDLLLTLEDLHSTPNKKGYILFATTVADDLPRTLDILKPYAAAGKTLTILVGNCPRGRAALVPIFIGGHKATQLLSNAASLENLPVALRELLQGDETEPPVRRAARHQPPAEKVAEPRNFTKISTGEKVDKPAARVAAVTDSRTAARNSQDSCGFSATLLGTSLALLAALIGA